MSSVAAILPAPDPEDHFLMFPNEALDRIGYLDPYELTTYAHLLRLTRGFHVASKRIGLERLEQRTSIKRTKLKSTIRSLEDKGLVHVDETPGRTNSYKVFLPRELLNWVEPTALKADVVEEEPQISKEPLTLVESHNTTQPSHDTTALKKTVLKEEIEQHTPVCVDSGPILLLKDLVDGAGFTAPLAGVTQGALDLAYKTTGVWNVLRLFITLILGYLHKVEILNPTALIKWALKSKDFIELEDKEIVSAFMDKINYFLGHVHPNEVRYFTKEINELKLFSKWLEINFDKIGLELLHNEYHKQCKESAVSYKFIWFFMIPDPSKQRNKKQ